MRWREMITDYQKTIDIDAALRAWQVVTLPLRSAMSAEKRNAL
jgi:hypothetical protein